MCESAEALGEPQLLESVRRQAVEMVDTALAEGLNAEGAMRYERTAAGYRDNLSWWPQCETVIGCCGALLGLYQRAFHRPRTRWMVQRSHFGRKARPRTQGQPVELSVSQCPCGI